jgi:hypothetical protein
MDELFRTLADPSRRLSRKAHTRITTPGQRANLQSKCLRIVALAELDADSVFTIVVERAEVLPAAQPDYFLHLCHPAADLVRFVSGLRRYGAFMEPSGRNRWQMGRRRERLK